MLKHYKKLPYAMALAIAAASLPASAQVNENRALMERIQQMEKSIVMLQRELSYRAVEGGDADANPRMMHSGSARTQAEVTSLEDELRKLRGQIEENDFQLRKLSGSFERLQKDVDSRLTALEQNSASTFSPAGTEPAITPSAASPSAPSTINDTPRPVNVTETPATTAGDGALKAPADLNEAGDMKRFETPRDHYNHAFSMLNQTNYDESSKYFLSFVAQYPNDPLIGNAYYWLGETNYIKRDYVKAADNFRQGFEALPEGPKAPDNLLKLGMTLSALNRNSDACTVLKQLTVKFNNTANSILQKAEQERSRIGCS